MKLSNFGTTIVTGHPDNTGEHQLAVSQQEHCMLSYLYRLAMQFESEHGCRPNLLYISPRHFECLCTDLAGIPGLGELVRFLGMEVVVTSGIGHPHLSYFQADLHAHRAV
jgi:hypothetical protein